MFMGKLLLFLAIAAGLHACKTSQKAQSIDKNSTRKAMLKALNWQEANPIFAKAPNDWTNGAYYIGVAKAHESTSDRAYVDALKGMGVRNAWKPWERFYHADDLAISYSYLYLRSIGEPGVQLEPTEKFIQDHLYRPHEWKSAKKEGNEPEEKQILWWWCDALFMAPPVIVVYAQQTKDSSLLNVMDRYYAETYELLYDKNEHLFARDTRFLWKGNVNDKKEKNGKKIFWARGNGWVLGGLALLLNDMPKNYSNQPFYENLFKEMAERIKGLQPEDGLWRTSLLYPESYSHGEVSGSGLYTFALAWGINNGLLKRGEYQPAVLKAWKAILACQQENGKVGWVQNIGADPGPATAESWQNFGTGAFLMAGSQVLKL
jgi:rhamnogalacturonyl hydrolase YesR